MVYNWRGPRSDTTSFVKMAWGVLQVRTTIENRSQEKLKKKVHVILITFTPEHKKSTNYKVENNV